MEILNWQINFTNNSNDKILDYFTDTSTNTYLLNTTQEEFDLLEKYVYDIAMFHFKRLNIEYNSDTNYIEFWWKNRVAFKNYHFDCDEFEKKTNNTYIYPLLSNIIYLNDSIYPTIITNIDLEKYKYKDFNNEKNITIVFPKKNKHISFDGCNKHGVSAIFEENKEDDPRYILAINLWNKKPTNVAYYESRQTESLYNIQIPFINIDKNDLKNTIIVKDILNYDFFEDLLYKNMHKCLIFSDLLKKSYHDGEYFFNIEEKREECNLEKIENNKLINDIENITTIDNIVSNNRFLQRFILNNIYSKDTCNWIINESELYAKENGGWTTNRHNNYPTTDIPIDKIKHIFKYVLGSLDNIITKIYKHYCMPTSININILDLFIVKYEESSQNKLDIHTDGSFLTFSIMLSSRNDYEGGGTQFNDGIKVFLEQGDVLVHSGSVKHSGLEITKGTRYILVGFTNIIKKLPAN